MLQLRTRTENTKEKIREAEIAQEWILKLISGKKVVVKWSVIRWSYVPAAALLNPIKNNITDSRRRLIRIGPSNRGSGVAIFDPSNNSDF